MSDPRSIPLLGDISLASVQRIAHALDTGYSDLAIAGLAGSVQERSGRTSHRIAIAGLLFGDSGADELAALQAAAAEGAELTFAADITTALEIQQVVIRSFHATELAGEPGRYAYELELAESPPLPPPAELSGFGGLDDFGLGDLGFDPGALGDMLGDVAQLAGEIAGAVDDALAVVNALSALSNLDGLSLGEFMAPIDKPVAAVGEIAKNFEAATSSLLEAFGA